MKTDIVIIGMGNIGRRYLQAASALSRIGNIICHDKRKNFQQGVNDFCHENSINKSRIRFVPYYSEILNDINKNSVLIVSTTAEGRGRIIRDLIRRSPLAIISEKPLCQDIREYERIIDLSKKTKVPVYLNFPRHLYPAYKKIKKQLNKTKSKTFSASFSEGMACSGIHILELATWLLDARDYKILYSRKGEVFKSKRERFWDFSGEIAFSINTQNLCFLKATRRSNVSSIEISCGNSEFNVFELEKKMTTLNLQNTGTESLSITIPLLSSIIGVEIEGICDRKDIELPTICQSYIAHKILFEYMKMNKLNKLNIT